MHRVLLIGLDGGSLDLVTKWKDELPNLRALMESGVYGRLESTVPPVTSPAWNSMFTGKNPGKIGIFDFLLFPFNKDAGFRIANLSHQDSPSLWDWLNDCGRKAGVVGVPTTFPPRRIDGFMVSGGTLVPRSNAQYTFPPKLRTELDEAAGGYETSSFVDLTVPGRERECLEKLARGVDKQVRAVKYLMKEYEWDFLTCVFSATDIAQHYLWHHMDETHPKHDASLAKTYGDGIKEIYKRADSAIGELLSAMPEPVNVLLVSDHGGAPVRGHFGVNEWLKREGLLQLHRRRRSFRPILSNILASLKGLLLKYCPPRLVQLIIDTVPARLLEMVTPRGHLREEGHQLIDAIDWSRAKAYSVGEGGGIFINVEDRSPESTEYLQLRDRIEGMLAQLTGPKGERVAVRAFKKEDVYWGRHLNAAPDLLYMLDDLTLSPKTGIGHGRVWIEPQVGGGHSLHGLFIASGPDIKGTGEQLQDLKIYDIAPTVLHLMGCPVPEDLDGRVLIETLAEDSEPGVRRVAFQDVAEKTRIRRRTQKLKRLGAK
jgi:predicted AlkP superfamily phosphohydrolase/phosphomutase